MRPQTVITMLDSRSHLSTAGLAAGQQYALAKKLPYAVVVRYKQDDRVDDSIFDELARLEQELRGCNIPLIVMFGQLAKVKNALTRHFHPVFLVSDEKGETAMQTHSYAWPGVMQDVSSIREYVNRVGIAGVCEV